VFKTTFSNISVILWRPVLVVEEARVNHRPMGKQLVNFNKTDRHDITEILLKVALNTIKQTNKNIHFQHTDLFHYLVHSTYANILKNIYKHFQQYFSYIMATSFSGGGSQSKPPTNGQATGKLYHLRLRVEFRFPTPIKLIATI
jgi:hypothetical protein